jgi:hypothetical protein
MNRPDLDDAPFLEKYRNTRSTFDMYWSGGRRPDTLRMTLLEGLDRLNACSESPDAVGALVHDERRDISITDQDYIRELLALARTRVAA